MEGALNLYDAGVFLGSQNRYWIEGSGYLGKAICCWLRFFHVGFRESDVNLFRFSDTLRGGSPPLGFFARLASLFLIGNCEKI